MKTRTALSALLMVAALASSGCVSAHPRDGYYYQPAVVVAPPPAPRYVAVAPPPSPGFVWVSAGWVWSGGRQHWMEGHWQPHRPPAPSHHHGWNERRWGDHHGEWRR